ncbi:MAG TPA: ribbon-helix-helix domain-containing protein [Thermoanaerobaculia bacterium]|nr:ribbon-helix-helix domain-containing protein [Thermoanaerobaculia bacterium]
MKVKTSITLPEDLLSTIDRRAAKLRKNRSEFIEAAVSRFIDQLDRQEISARDIAIIDRNSDALNAEAEDVLSYQSLP